MVILKPWEKYNGDWHVSCQALYSLRYDTCRKIETVRTAYDPKFSSRIYYCAIYHQSNGNYWRYALDRHKWWIGQEVSWTRYVSLDQCKEAADKALAATSAYYITKSTDEFEKITLLD